jgi:hypothetical protein
MWMNAVWAGATLIQLALDQRVLMVGPDARFVGMSPNPQAAALSLAPMICIGLWLIFNDSRRRWRPLWVGLVALDVVLLLWTGSRTGVGMTVLGAMAVMYRRLGRSIIFVPVVAGAAYGLLLLVSGLRIDVVPERLATLQNTRAQVWAILIGKALEHPIIGVGREGAEASENSYLYGFAAFGIGMLLLMLLFTAVSAWQVARVIRVRALVPWSHRSVPDLIVAFNIIYFAGAVFEGYLLARVAGLLVLMLLFGAMATRVIELARRAPAFPPEEIPASGGRPWFRAARRGGTSPRTPPRSTPARSGAGPTRGPPGPWPGRGPGPSGARPRPRPRPGPTRR